MGRIRVAGPLAALLLAAGVTRGARAEPATATGATAVDWTDRASGTSFRLGGGVEALSFSLYPTAAVAYVEGSFDVRLVKEVSFRITHMVGFGGGEAEDAYITILPALRVAIRFNPVPYYSLWLGYEGRAGVVGAFGYVHDPVSVLPLHGPDISLAAFRFGSRGQYELEHDGGLFVAPIWGYHFGFVARYSFEP
jgi:hypothetical protein